MDPAPSSSHPLPDDNTTHAEPDSHRDKRWKSMASSPVSDSASLEEALTFDEPEDAFYKEVDHDMTTHSAVRAIKSLFPENLPEDSCGTLFMILVQSFQGRLQLNVAELLSLLEEQTELKQVLRDSWKHGSYRKLSECLLKYIQTVSPPQPDETGPTGVGFQDEVQQAVKAGWNTPYQGNNHVLLFKNLNSMVKREPYKNVCALVQSSGAGKSRMVDEQAKLVYTLPINIRSQDGTCAAYPPPDQLVRRYLLSTSQAGDLQIHYLAFFRCLFHHATAELGQLKNQAQKSQSGFAEIWRERMNDRTYRDKFYFKVVRSCAAIMMTPVDDEQREAVVKETCLALNGLSNELDRCFKSTSNIKIMISIDDANELKSHAVPGNTSYTLLDVLCSVIGNFYDQPLCCLLVSTQPFLQLWTPHASGRTAVRLPLEPSRELSAPITETPFDCAPDIELLPGVLHLENLADIHHLAKWGRPLWWSMLESGGGGMDGWHCSRERLINIARMKLLRRQDIDTTLEKVSLTALTATLDVLLTLDFEPTRETIHDRWLGSLRNEAEMVANHMRIVYSVPRHRQYLRSGYPSEPLLAEAAAQQIHHFQSQVKDGTDIMVHILRQIVEHSWVNLGEHGEIVMRLLLTRAYMDGVLAERTSSTIPPVFSRGCGLITFIEQLFTPERAKSTLDTQPHNKTANTVGTFRELFKDSVVRFTHFAKGGDQSVCTTEALFVAFARGMAFICCQDQEHIDLIIPVLLDKSDTLRESAMSAILVQAKRRLGPHGVMAYSFDQEDAGLFPKGGDKKSRRRPYIILTTDLMDKGKKKSVSVARNHDTHPCFFTVTWSCSNALFKAVGEQTTEYQQLLASRDLLDDQPRQDPESRSVVMKLKPFWRYGEDSFHFTSSKVLREAK